MLEAPHVYVSKEAEFMRSFFALCCMWQPHYTWKFLPSLSQKLGADVTFGCQCNFHPYFNWPLVFTRNLISFVHSTSYLLSGPALYNISSFLLFLRQIIYQKPPDNPPRNQTYNHAPLLRADTSQFIVECLPLAPSGCQWAQWTYRQLHPEFLSHFCNGTICRGSYSCGATGNSTGWNGSKVSWFALYRGLLLSRPWG